MLIIYICCMCNLEHCDSQAGGTENGTATAANYVQVMRTENG